MTFPTSLSIIVFGIQIRNMNSLVTKSPLQERLEKTFPYQNQWEGLFQESMNHVKKYLTITPLIYITYIPFN